MKSFLYSDAPQSAADIEDATVIQAAAPISDPFPIVEEVVRNPIGLTRKQTGFTRNEVVEAFHDAFRIIGGVQRLALWANDNPDKFYPLYAKLLPSTAITLGQTDAVQIEHVIPRGPLDNHPTAEEVAKAVADNAGY